MTTLEQREGEGLALIGNVLAAIVGGVAAPLVELDPGRMRALAGALVAAADRLEAEVDALRDRPAEGRA